MPNTNRPLRNVQVYDLSDGIRYRKYYYENFKGGQSPISWVEGATNSHPVAPLATGGAEDGELDQGVTLNAITPGSCFWQAYITVAQAKNPFIGSAGNGLNIAGDATDNDALEFVPGGNSAYSRFAQVIGTDKDFFIKVKLKIADADGSDQFLVGFRKQEAFAVPVSVLTTGDGTYTDFCGIGFAATVANPNVVKVAYDLNDSGSTTVVDTGFTWADNEVHTLEMRVVNRKARFLINGNRLGGSITKDGDGTSMTAETTVSAADNAFTFDSGDTVIPFIFLRHDAAVSQAHYIQEIEIGRLVDIGEDPNQE